jgi:methylphosphotriester-DNA--protein-cysteine methyltransferase
MQQGDIQMKYEKPILKPREVADGFLEFVLPGNNVTLPLDWRALKLKEFIDTHPGTSHLNLDAVCTDLRLGLSERQARRLFKASVQMGFREYTKNRRLALAAGQLQATNISVKAIAIDAGYHSTRHFARSFKELFQLRPMEFRKVWKQRDAAA